ncbi:hypothetical protein BJX62DRAFT_239321 [Aspergillus germanicus]
MIKEDASLKKRKEKEKDYVVFDEKALTEAKKAADAKAKDDHLPILLVQKIAYDNRYAILEMVNEPTKVENKLFSDDILSPFIDPATIITKLPYEDFEELVDLLERLSKRGELKNKFGVQQDYVKKQEGRYIKKK